jgi:ABC-2 type transport system ATP-binding protein/nitrous oxidase accessory protein
MVIEVNGLSKTYGVARVLDEVTFTAGAGEVIALLGPNGAGKTTLLKCLLGLARFDGEARIDGLDVRRAGKETRRLVGYVPQAPAFPSYLTVADALEYFADLRGLRGMDIDAAMARVGLTAHADKKVDALSGGLRQRLGLAVALLGDPPILLMDEPVASIDPDGRRVFTRLVEDLRAEGRTVIVSTHVLRLLEGVADRALVLVDGRLVYDGSLTAVLAEDALEQLVDAAQSDTEFDDAPAPAAHDAPTAKPFRPLASALRALWGEEVS